MLYFAKKSRVLGYIRLNSANYIDRFISNTFILTLDIPVGSNGYIPKRKRRWDSVVVGFDSLDTTLLNDLKKKTS